ncbi:cytochrome c-type biogenesis protein CcmH [Pseudonocardia ammonioxydans]|uniref:Cytochrome c-type biogenesis protein n=1 Tax=Pseudonocardia ammonioxydans TaxID=260086 RepID=A0A1I5HB11_PSUAM|nr:cytochrome c-type biogenesis protein [Pseudonocardia ammonioxydans]SFO45482.1 cytochrome c-type biogenesis protein CcmH [Pseudonocardia ammonioxydans]
MREHSLRRGSVLIGVAVLLLSGVVAVVLVLAPAPERDRVQDLAEGLRCPVCTSVSVAESPSDTAVAMRQVISDQVAAGRSDEEVVNYFRARYGDWTVIDPPASGSTLLLWALPIAAAVAGSVALLARSLPRAVSPSAELSDEERDRVEAAVERHRAMPGRREVDP